MPSSVKQENNVKRNKGGRKPGKPSKRTSIYMEEILRDRLVALKTGKNLNFNTVVNNALREYLDKPSSDQPDFDFAQSLQDSLPEGVELVDQKFLRACSESFLRNLTDLSRLKSAMENKTLARFYDRPEIRAYLADGLAEVVRLGQEMFYLSEEQTKAFFDQLFEEQVAALEKNDEADVEDPSITEQPKDPISGPDTVEEEILPLNEVKASRVSKFLAWLSK